MLQCYFVKATEILQMQKVCLSVACSDTSGVAVDAATGGFLATDRERHKIRRFDQDGRYVGTFGHGQGRLPGQLDNPQEMALSPEGRLSVCDFFNSRVQFWDEQGRYGGLLKCDSFPRCVALGPGQLIVSFNSYVGIFSADGQQIKSLRGGPQPCYPTGLAANSRDDLLVGTSKGSIYLFDVQNDQADVIYEPTFPSSCIHLAVDSFDRIVVSDWAGGRLHFLDAGFQYLGSFGSWGCQPGQFKFPMSLCFDEHLRRLLVCDSCNNRVQVLTCCSEFTTF